MKNVTIAVTQMSCTSDREHNINNAANLVRKAAAKGAQVVVLQELFETPYFCIDKDKKYMAEALAVEANPAIKAMQKLARELNVVIPISFYELAGPRYFNSLAMIDADGVLLGIYRKSHIPDFPRYEEAFYFEQGDTGFMIFDTKYGRIGGAVCWDQWFPEAARIMALKGAEIIVYPTAIGVDLAFPDYHSRQHWQQTMQGHAAANMVVVAASNRVGLEHGETGSINFYGGSFIADQFGTLVGEAGEEDGEIVINSFDLDAIREVRRRWGIYRTRRTDLYDSVKQSASQDLLDDRAVS